MDSKEVKLRVSALLRRAGLEKVPAKVLACLAILCLALVVVVAVRFWPLGQADASDDFQVETQTQVSTSIAVDVEGAVACPGLYELDAGSRVAAAVEAAGGFSDDALRTSVNLAELLEDGQQITVAFVVEESTGGGASAASGVESGKVNINTASVDELQTLSGIGAVLAQRIVDYRDANGRFSSIDDLQDVSGIGATRFESLKDSICV